MSFERNRAHIEDHWERLWMEGFDWARCLRKGQRFLGSYGEAKARGYEGADANAFHGGANAALKDAKGIWTKGNSSRIVRIEW